eukprot:scaffold25063_cov55-Isochrysis_galbana.AAC.1
MSTRQRWSSHAQGCPRSRPGSAAQNTEGGGESAACNPGRGRGRTLGAIVGAGSYSSIFIERPLAESGFISPV